MGLAISLVILVLAIGTIVWKISAWVKENDIYKITVDKMGVKLDNIGTKLEEVYQNTRQNTSLKSQSPISLTAIGKEIVKEVSAVDIFNKYSDKLVRDVNEEGPENAYDIQRCAFDVVKDNLIPMLSDGELSVFKQSAYNRGVPIDDITSVFGVLLRDKILEQKNIPISEVDDHADPAG